jgi:hypothetical protein
MVRLRLALNEVENSMFGHPLLWLALATFGVVVAYAIYNLAATLKQLDKGSEVGGIGGKHDPLA